MCRDEGGHCQFACALYELLQEKLEDSVVHDIVREAVDIERDFVTSALPVALIGMNAELMSQYIEFVADRLLQAIGCSKLYGTANPFDFMEQLSLQGKTNFFGETRCYLLCCMPTCCTPLLIHLCAVQKRELATTKRPT